MDKVKHRLMVMSSIFHTCRYLTMLASSETRERRIVVAPATVSPLDLRALRARPTLALAKCLLSLSLKTAALLPFHDDHWVASFSAIIIERPIKFHGVPIVFV